MNNLLQGWCAPRARLAPMASAAATVALLAGPATAVHGAGLAQASATCAGAETPIQATTLDAARSALACLIDAVRTERGLGPVRADAHLERAARSHAADMVRRDYFAHRSPGGSEVSDRLARAGGTPPRGARWGGEILATGDGAAATPRRLVAAWLNSPPHRSVLLSTRPDAIGIGAVRDTPDGRHVDTGITVDAVLGRRCDDGGDTDLLSGYDRDQTPDACAG
jgi:uncharacterized protein YkwD